MTTEARILAGPSGNGVGKRRGEQPDPVIDRNGRAANGAGPAKWPDLLDVAHRFRRPTGRTQTGPATLMRILETADLFGFVLPKRVTAYNS